MHRMNALKQALARRPLIWFFALAYALSWVSAPLLGGPILPQGPMFAAVILLLAVGGRQALARAWRANTPARVPGRWYLIAPGIVMAIYIATMVVLPLWGVRMVSPAHLALLGPVLFELMLLGGQWEEPGWSGYALPALQARFARHRFGQLWASLVLGGLRAVWHLPLAAYGLIPWIEVWALSTPYQFIISWLYNRTRGSLAVVMLYHLAANVFHAIFAPMVVEPDLPLHFAVKVGLFAVTALALVLLDLRQWITPVRAGQTAAASAGPQLVD
jgi:uncharacterized protein